MSEALINCDAKLKIAKKALEKIANVKTVGYTEARKARLEAQHALLDIEHIEACGSKPVGEKK